MKFCGLQKTTLLDFPGKVAATLFLGGCNFRCPFCHNSQLLSGNAEEILTEEDLFAFLQKRRTVLDGVCITGGEPTLDESGLKALIQRIRSLGYLVKLDTNGYRPTVLRRLCEEGLLDYVAMDIKAGREHYALAAGLPELHLNAIEESVEYLLSGNVPFEFRTTVVRGLHTEQDLTDIGNWLTEAHEGKNISYFLQGFVDSGHVLKDGFSAFTREEMLKFLEIIKEKLPRAELRGVEY